MSLAASARSSRATPGCRGCSTRRAPAWPVRQATPSSGARSTTPVGAPGNHPEIVLDLAARHECRSPSPARTRPSSPNAKRAIAARDKLAHTSPFTHERQFRVGYDEPTKLLGHRQPRERRGRQMPAPTRRQGSQRAIQETRIRQTRASQSRRPCGRLAGSASGPALTRLRESPMCLPPARSAATCTHTSLSLAWRSGHLGPRRGRCWR